MDEKNRESLNVKSNKSEEFSVADKLAYLKTVRENLARFEDISVRLIVQGMPLIIGLITIGSAFAKNFTYVSTGSIIGAISFTMVLIFMSRYYTMLIRVCSRIAVELENEVFGEKSNLRLTVKIVEKGRPTMFGKTLHIWDFVILSGFVVLLIIEFILLYYFLTLGQK